MACAALGQGESVLVAVILAQGKAFALAQLMHLHPDLPTSRLLVLPPRDLHRERIENEVARVRGLP